jgi:hypothetical protein
VLVQPLDLEAEAGGEVLLVADHHVDVLRDLAVDLLGAGLAALLVSLGTLILGVAMAQQPSKGEQALKYRKAVYQAIAWNMGPMGAMAQDKMPYDATEFARRAENVVAFYNKRGTCERWIKEGKGAIKWTRLSCRSFTANAVRLQLHALAYNLGNFMRTLATPEPISDWSMTTLREKLIKIAPGSSAMAAPSRSRWPEVAVPKNLFAEIFRMIADLRPPPVTSTAWGIAMSRVQSKTRGEVRLDEGEFGNFSAHQP